MYAGIRVCIHSKKDVCITYVHNAYIRLRSSWILFRYRMDTQSVHDGTAHDGFKVVTHPRFLGHDSVDTIPSRYDHEHPHIAQLTMLAVMIVSKGKPTMRPTRATARSESSVALEMRSTISSGNTWPIRSVTPDTCASIPDFTWQRERENKTQTQIGREGLQEIFITW